MRCILLGITVWSLLALTACVDDEAPTLVITNAIPLDDDCVAKAGEEVVRSRGYYDVYCASSYTVPFEVWTYMVPRYDPERPRSETNIVQFETAEVELMLPDGAIIQRKFSTSANGTAEPGDGTDPGKSVVRVELIPAMAVNSLPSPTVYPTIIAQIQLFGKTNGDVDVETGTYRFPIDICDGCFTVTIDDCLWSPEDIKMISDAPGCQHGHGYDGAFCWCNGTPTTNSDQCEYCSTNVN